MFSNLSSSSISLATVTPSLVVRGAPKDLSRITLRPLGPRVTLTALARISTPRSMRSRASLENLTSLAAIYRLLEVVERLLGSSGGGLLGGAAFEHPHNVGFLHDQIFDTVDLDLGARPFTEQNDVVRLDIYGDELAVLVAAAGANGN